MAYCGPRGIPLSGFLAWADGDQQAALAWQDHEARRCNGCGTHPEDWDPDGDHDPAKRRRHVEVHRCQGCAEVQQRAETDEFKNGGRGQHIVTAHGPAKGCPRCDRPD